MKMPLRLFTILVFGLTFLPLPSPAAEETLLMTTIKNQRFVPDEIHAKEGQSFVLRVINEDTVPVEFESSDLNKEKMVQPGKSIDLPFKGLKAGTYEFFSDFGPKELKGKIVVN